MFVILIISLITRLFFFSETILLEKKNTVVKFNDCKNPKACSIFFMFDFFL